MTDVPVVRAADSEREQRRAAAALQAAGLGAGDRILLSAPASPALLAVVRGALRTGVVPVVLDPALPTTERAALAADADPALDLGAEPERLLTGDDLAHLADVPLARPMHYTSGTTGRRKGVWSGVLPDDDAAALAAEETDLWNFTADDRHLVLSPLHGRCWTPRRPEACGSSTAPPRRSSPSARPTTGWPTLAASAGPAPGGR